MKTLIVMLLALSLPALAHESALPDECDDMIRTRYHGIATITSADAIADGIRGGIELWIDGQWQPFMYVCKDRQLFVFDLQMTRLDVDGR